ncbi:MAG TPA: hypothetical protein PKA98_22870, partial [Acidimicrobiales bacterium]|nr:hypothetical protein [Acidimicrobiales bacterium]
GRFRAAGRMRAALGRPGSAVVPLEGRARRRNARAALRLIDVPTPVTATAPLVRVFVNHPALGPDTAPAGPHYVGTVAFFGTWAQNRAVLALAQAPGLGFSPDDLCFALPGQAAASEPRTPFELPLTRVLARLEAAGKPLGERVTIQLVPVPLGEAAAQVVVEPSEVEIEFF